MKKKGPRRPSLAKSAPRPALPPRVIAAMAAVALLSLAAVFSFLGEIREESATAADPYLVAQQIERFAPAAARIPTGAVVGYLSDLNPNDTAGRAAFLTAQYALAPRLLVQAASGHSFEWAVGNFSRPQDFAAAGKRLGLTMVADLGSGVTLFRKDGR